MSLVYIKSTYSHVQEVADTEWNINHKLGRTVATDCFLYIDGKLEKVLPVSVEIIDDLNVRVTWSSPRSGEARCV